MTKLPKEDTGPMMSLAECKKILNAEENRFSDEDVLALRDFLYSLARLELQHFLDKQEAEARKVKAHSED